MKPCFQVINKASLFVCGYVHKRYPDQNTRLFVICCKLTALLLAQYQKMSTKDLDINSRIATLFFSAVITTLCHCVMNPAKNTVLLKF